MIRGKRRRPLDTELRETRPADLVDRHFHRFRTNQLWVADFTYVWTWSGWVYVAFVFDAHSRRIIGWRTATKMTTPLVLDCLEMAFFTRRREGVTGFAGLTHHTDAGSVYTSIAFTDRLVDERIDPSVGSVGDTLLTGYSTREPRRRHAGGRRVRRVCDARVQHVSHDGQGSPAARAA